MTTPTQPSAPERAQTIVFFHAHPDDEASSTGGTIAKAAAAGHRVIVVYGTNGDHGEVPDDLVPGETIVDRRHREAEASARELGTASVEWLGYADSGMTGWEQNKAEGSFCRADVDEAGRRLAAILDREDADVLVCYDDHGNYGHPDHVMVHTVAMRAAELAARRPRILQSTMNRDELRRQYQAALAAGATDVGFDPDEPGDDGNPIGSPEDAISWAVDVSDVLDRKRAALASHASQTSDIGMFMAMPMEYFRAGFGTEYFLEEGRSGGMRRAWPL